MRQQKRGAIINITSIAAITTYPYVGYKATKNAMIAFTEQLANARHCGSSTRQPAADTDRQLRAD